MKRLFLIIIAAFWCIMLNAQITVTSLNQGAYSYNSLYQNSDLHFYLYNDGHHSFQPDNIHQFGTYANGSTIEAFHSKPYDVDQVEQLILNTVYDGTATPQTPTYTFDNKVALKRSWGLVNDEENYFVLMFENQEEKPISGCVEFHFSTHDIVIDQTKIKDNYGNSWVDPNEDLMASDYLGYTDKFVWEFIDLDPREQRFIYIPANCRAEVFDIVNTRAVIKVDRCEDPVPIDPEHNGGDGSNPNIIDSDYYTLSSQVRNFPHDPNGIVTDPNCLVKEDTYHTVRYKIYFQNDGIDPVKDAILYFKVQAPFHTIELKEASHTCEMTWQPVMEEANYSKPVQFNFFNIFLDGSGATPPPEYDATYGWVTFDICFNLKLFTIHGIDCASSVVDIEFDGFPPVTAYNEICRNCDFLINSATQANPINYYLCPDLLPNKQETEGIGVKLTSTETTIDNSIEELRISPNPTNDILFINAQDFDKSNIVKIRNTSGEVIQKLSIGDIDQNLNLADIPAGVYYISVQNDTSVKTKAFVKL